jgi:hypothetical protein
MDKRERVFHIPTQLLQKHSPFLTDERKLSQAPLHRHNKVGRRSLNRHSIGAQEWLYFELFRTSDLLFNTSKSA